MQHRTFSPGSSSTRHAAGFRQAGCPRRAAKRRLTIQALLVASFVMLSPLAGGGQFISQSFGEQASAGLAIESPTLDLAALSATDDGFLMKSGAQTAEESRVGMTDIIEYTVESGDSVSTIARRFGVSANTILWENNIANANSLKVGSTLRILPVSGLSHTAAAGDTVEKLAAKYKIDAKALAAQNNIGEGGSLVAGTRLILPGARKEIELAPARVATRAVASSGATRGKVQTAAAISPSKSGKWMIKPTDGIYTQYFKSGHYAVDIANRAQPGIVAAAAGTVSKAQCGWNGGYGCMVVIDHGDGVQTLYAHMAGTPAVSAGDAVGQGDVIGKMGKTGNVHGKTGIHTHFEVIVNGKKKNPLAFY